MLPLYIGSPKSRISFSLRLDLPLLITVILLCMIGLAVQFSAGGEDLNQLWRHAVRICVTILVMLFLASLPMELIQRFTPTVYIIGIVLLLLVLAVGLAGRGAQRWLDFGFVLFQPSELAKVTVPAMVAWILAGVNPGTRQSGRFWICGVLVFIPGALVYLQPDLGTALLIVSVGGFTIFLGGLAWRWVGLLGFMVVLMAPLSWPFLQDYQKNRVLTLFNPWNDPLGHGYQPIQSMVAIGSGGIVGKGWLQGSQSQLEFLPERVTDFAFAVFAEEFGFLGSIGLLLIYSFLVVRCMTIACSCQSYFAKMVSGSIAMLIFLHLFINIGMGAGMLPVVGLPLPFLSYGGSSMLAVMMGIGLVMSASHASQTS